MNSNSKNISLFLGAGAEYDYDMPTGPKFKSETILCKNTVPFIENMNSLNGTAYEKKFRNGAFIRSNSTNILYQSYKELSDDRKKEMKKLLDEGENNALDKYVLYRESKKEYTDKEKKSIKDDFSNLFIKKVYNPVKSGENPKIIEFLSFYSSIDSDFNYLRLPDTYINECCNVIKLYYSAYLSILSKLVGNDVIFKLQNEKEDIRSKLLEEYKNGIEKVKERESTYYSIIKEVDYIDTIVTTNYTTIIDELFENQEIYHLHGTMLDFENLYTRKIKKLDEFNKEDIIFPYILIQSGIKPIINPKQMEIYVNAYKQLDSADYILVLGYSFCNDDEHIINMFRELLKKDNVRLVYLKYVEKNDNRESKKIKKEENGKLKKMFNCDGKKTIVELLRNIDDFEEILETYKNK